MLKILFISKNHSPFKHHSGAQQRTNLIFRSLSKIAHVDVITLDQIQDGNIDNCSKIEIKTGTKRKIRNIIPLFLQPIYIKTFDFFRPLLSERIIDRKNGLLSRQAKRIIKKGNYDFIFVRYINSLISFGIKPTKKVILDIDDLPEQFYQSKLSMLNNCHYLKLLCYKMYYSFCIKKYHSYTKKITDNVLVSYLPNEQQCSSFDNVVYLPNIPYKFDRNDSQKSFPKVNAQDSQYRIMYVGTLKYPPAFMGVEHFLDNIYPLVLESIPEVNFNIIGDITNDLKTRLLSKYKNINVLGFVDDLEKEYQTCSLVVAPCYIGAGTNIKILEAMSYGKVCVINSFAKKGFDKILIDGKNILIADNDSDFAKKIIEVLTKKYNTESIGNCARETIDNQCSFENFSKIIEASICLERKN